VGIQGFVLNWVGMGINQTWRLKSRLHKQNPPSRVEILPKTEKEDLFAQFQALDKN
jgi:hypothetical protein